MESPHLFPITLSLHHKKCLVVGGGNIAERRVRSLLDCGAIVHIVSPALTPWLHEAAQRGAVQWTRGPFQPGHLHDSMLVLVATDAAATNTQIAKLAREQRCLVNVADDPPHCDFYLPAVVRRDHLTLAISTEGQAPAFAAWLRKFFERLLRPDLGQLLKHYAGQRHSMQQRYPNMTERTRAWEYLFADDKPEIFVRQENDTSHNYGS